VSFGFYFAIYYGSEALVSPGGYTQGVTLGISNTLQPNGENVTLTGTAPTGLNVSFTPTSPLFLPGDKAVNVTLTLTASSTLASGNYTIGVKGVSGANSQSASFSLDVVQYRVVMTQNTFFPGVLNVTVGSTVYWQNFDGPAGGCGAASTGTGQHNVVFTTLQGANSSTINQFQIYKYTFTTAGSYFYYSSLDTDHLMNGTINVAGAAGGLGMAVTMPAFSLFKGGSALEVPPGAIAATAATVPAGAETAPASAAARGLGFGDLVFPDAHSSPFSGLGLGAAVTVLLGLAALGAALAVSTTGKRELTAVGAERLSRPLPSGASH
jgi:plastocyanin